MKYLQFSWAWGDKAVHVWQIPDDSIGLITLDMFERELRDMMDYCVHTYGEQPAVEELTRDFGIIEIE